VTKSKLLVVLLCVSAATALSAQASAQTFKVGYIPTSIGQANTNAWQVGMMRVFDKNPNVKGPHCIFLNGVALRYS